jgi:hypothetical protein
MTGKKAMRSRMGQRLLCVAIVAAWTRVGLADEVIDRVLAVVAGDVIMLSDVRAARDLQLVDPGTASDPDRAVLSQLIDRALILDEVDRYAPPEPSADAVDRAFNAVRAHFATTPAFTAALARVGLDERQLRATLRQNLRIRAYLDQRFAGETPERGEAIITAWVAGLRARATIVDLDAPAQGRQ